MYARKFLSFAVSVTTVLAANETVKLFLPEFHGDSLVGKVIGMVCDVPVGHPNSEPD
jgi:hypothetical protein